MMTDVPASERLSDRLAPRRPPPPPAAPAAAAAAAAAEAAAAATQVDCRRAPTSGRHAVAVSRGIAAVDAHILAAERTRPECG